MSPTTRRHRRNTTVRSRETAIGARCRRPHALADAPRWSAQTETAITNGGGIRRRQGLPAGRDPDPVRRARRASVRQPARDIRRDRRRAHGRDRERALAPP
jgi:hypothetical protein